MYISNSIEAYDGSETRQKSLLVVWGFCGICHLRVRCDLEMGVALEPLSDDLEKYFGIYNERQNCVVTSYFSHLLPRLRSGFVI